jgi:RND superfamily putative drug exporter
MALLGERNWYLPRWLSWLPPVGLEDQTAPEVAAASGRQASLTGREAR